MPELNRRDHRLAQRAVQVAVSFLLAFVVWCGMGDVAAAAAPGDATGVVTNTVAVSSSTYDPDLLNNSATQTTTVTAEADLQISKDDGLSAVAPGEMITYTIVVTNGGPSAVRGAIVRDEVSVAVALAGWRCGATVDSSCGVLNGSARSRPRSIWLWPAVPPSPLLLRLRSPPRIG
ncbi:MAG: hypothetical protein R2867_16310 [Caldilineaceae bacterium]